MIIAEIYFNNIKVSERALDVDYPPHTIREIAAQPLQPSWNPPQDEWDWAADAKCAIWIYTLKGQTEHQTFRYNFDGAQSQKGFARPFGRIMDFGFNDDPNENVNLDKLTSKLRDKENMRSLLLQYFETG